LTTFEPLAYVSLGKEAMKKITITLTLPEASHLLDLIHERHKDGSYYGRKDQYYARTKRLGGMLIREMEKAGGAPGAVLSYRSHT